MSIAQELEEMDLGPVTNLVPLPLPDPVAPVPAMTEFERCKAWLEAGLEHAPLTMMDVLEAIGEGRATFWPGKDCAIVTEIVPYEQMKVVRVMTAGGDMGELKALRAGIEAMARLQGCTHAEVEGRKGWERELKSEGFAFASVILRKAL